MPTALITGITGQTGSYLAELLLNKGYIIHGLIRRSSSFNTQRIDQIYKDQHDDNCKLFLHFGDLSDASGLYNVIHKAQPDEIYNLGGQSHVRVSFDTAEYTVDVVGNGVTRMLEAIRHQDKQIKFYQASSSEMFGASPPPQSETTLFEPRSPYACAKAMAYNLVRMYRDAYGLFACNGILFNHEAPRRGPTFVTRKITRAIASIMHGDQEFLYLGNLEAKRDWGHAREYAEAIYAIMQHSVPDDFVIATGEAHSVQEFLDEAFNHAGMKVEDYVRIDQKYFRPSEVDSLLGDASKAKRLLGWEPKVKFKELVKEMVDHDCLFRKLNGYLAP